jgi:hypothetical protein
MRPTICLFAALALVPVAAPVGAKAAPKSAGFQINHTTWTMTTKKGTKLRESVDSDGNFVTETSAGKQVDHGTAMMKDGKVCFDSAVGSGDNDCWTATPTAIGHSMETVSDKGDKLRVTRVAYVAMKARAAKTH